MKNTERDLAFYVVDIFEDLLDEKDIDIPCADSSEEDGAKTKAQHESMALNTVIWLTVWRRC